MWDDVVIGYGNKMNTAHHISAIPGDHGISQNQNCYWISDCVLRIGMTIFKNSLEGKFLTEKIKAGESAEEIYSWLNEVAVANINKTDLLIRIQSEMEKSFEAGRRAKAEEFRFVLNN